MRKRLLASMIAMVLLLSLFPVSALAAERQGQRDAGCLRRDRGLYPAGRA